MGASAYGTWASSLDALVSYRYVGCRSVATDDDHAVGGFALRSDLRLGAGVLGAPVAIAVLDTAGINQLPDQNFTPASGDLASADDGFSDAGFDPGGDSDFGGTDV